MQCNWQCTLDHTQKCHRECLESLHVSIQASRLAVYHRVQLGASLRVRLEGYWRINSEVYFGVHSDCSWNSLDSLF